MYEVKMINGENERIINIVDVNSVNRCFGAVITSAVNDIPSFKFTLYPNNTGFSIVTELKSIIKVFNTKTQKYDFEGRVLKISDSMNDDGSMSKNVLCEGYLAYLYDTVQLYHVYSDYDIPEYINAILNVHNAQVSLDKKIYPGIIEKHTVKTYISGYEKTYESLKRLIEEHGGEFRIRSTESVLYLDYVEKFGERITDTTIQLAKNLSSLSIDKNSSNIITRLFPLGAKTSGEERLNISTVNSGLMYIDDLDAQAQYGIVSSCYIFDDVTDPAQLKSYAQDFLSQNNKIKISYKIKAVDLSLINLDIHSFDLYNEYLLINTYMAFEDYVRIVKKTIDINNPQNSQLEVGDKFQKITDVASKVYNYIEYKFPLEKNDWLETAKENASALINNAFKGYVVITDSEVLIMDTPSKETATKVWRWNAAGLGYSSTGYNGSYGLALTMDGAFVADFITVGTLSADRVRAGTLTSVNINSVNIASSNIDSVSDLQKTEIKDGVLSYFRKVNGVWEPTARFNIIANSNGEFGAVMVTDRWYGIGKTIEGGVLVEYIYEPDGWEKHYFSGGVQVDRLVLAGSDLEQRILAIEQRLDALEV